jgi:hypothetical protein
LKKTEVLHLLQQPEQITFKEYEKLEDIAGDYPFFTVLHALLAKASKNLNTPDQEHKLQTAALQSLNRPHLKKLMDFEPVQVLEEENISGSEEKGLTETPSEQSEKDNTLAETSEDDDNNLLLTAVLEADNDEEPPLTEKQKAQKQIIDSFINSKVGIIKADPDTSEHSKIDLAKESGQLSGKVISENFAKVLAQQGKINKAIEMYEKLSLKYPEKSSYFASLIKKLNTN